jgi:tRNA-dihydrouridine synthase B
MPYEKKLAIGGVRTPNPIWLAPLAGVTTRTYRKFHARLGAGLVHTEMISAVGLSYKNKKTLRMLGDDSEPGPSVLQLFGPDAGVLSAALRIALEKRRFDAIEINMACPMPKVTRRCGGASLLNDPGEARRMVEALKPVGLPVWVKMRKSGEKQPLGTEDFCGEMLAGGADLLIVHGRTPEQRYEGLADVDSVISAAQKFPGLVAASGDFYAPSDAKRYLDGGCAAVLAARGAMADVFLIPKTLAFLGFEADERYLDPSAADQISMIIESGRAACSDEGAPYALVMARRLLSGMLKGFRGVSSLRQACSSVREWESFEEALKNFDLKIQ